MKKSYFWVISAAAPRFYYGGDAGALVSCSVLSNAFEWGARLLRPLKSVQFGLCGSMLLPEIPRI